MTGVSWINGLGDFFQQRMNAASSGSYFFLPIFRRLASADVLEVEQKSGANENGGSLRKAALFDYHILTLVEIKVICRD